MVVTALLVYGVPSAIAGVVIGYVALHIAQKMITYKCRQRGNPEPQKPFTKWLKLLCGLVMAVLTALVITGGEVFLGGTFRYRMFFAVAFATIALIISLIDCRIHLIPNELVLLLLGLGFIYRLLFDGWYGLVNALLALGASILIFGGSSAVFYFIKKQSGLGAGDLKYAFTICAVVGTSGLIPFLCGMAVAILLYVFFVIGRHLLLMGDYFPMAAHLSVGFLIALLMPYISAYVAQPLAILTW